MNAFKLLITELHSLGFKNTLWRIWFELKRRTIIFPLISHLNIKIKHRKFKKKLDLNKINFGIIGLEVSSYPLKKTDHILDSDLIIEANNILEYKFPRFSNEIVNLNSFDWFYEPDSDIRWPSNISSEKILVESDKYGDIKLIWEIGRLSWLMTLSRAYIYTGKEEYLHFGLNAIDNFYMNNSIGKGPHWCSEQEVAIRSYNIIWFFDLCNSNLELDSNQKVNYVSILHLHYCFIDSHLSYAKNAIRNNHLIHGLVGILAISKFLNLSNEKAFFNAKNELTISINEQWYPDGGYVQPSFIYHRSADYGLIFLRKFLTPGENLDLLIIKSLENSYKFLRKFINKKTGAMPNWGANDGSRVFYLSDNTYLDFRPLLSLISIISSNSSPFSDKGSLSEILLFFHKSEEEIEEIRKVSKFNSIKLSRNQGLHSIYNNTYNANILFRCGSVKNRYALHADQLHLDLSIQDSQVFQGSGSYSYNKDIKAHNYFRGTKSKNTVMIDGESQMIHHRKFKFLNWTKSSLLTSRTDFGKNFIIGGIHDGYLKSKSAMHSRLLFSTHNNSICILDKVWSIDSKNLKDIKMSFNLNLDLNYDSNKNQILLQSLNTRISFLSSAPIDIQISEKLNSKQDYYEDSISLYYNSLKKNTKLNISSRNNSDIYFLTIIEFDKTHLQDDHQSMKKFLEKENIYLDKIDKYLDNIIN